MTKNKQKYIIKKGELLKKRTKKYTKYMCCRIDNNKLKVNISLHHSHDKSIRMLLKDRNEATRFINKVVFNEEKIKIGDIEEYTENFITSNYKDKVADIVYKYCPIDGVYFLIEHQTKIDQNMPIRIAEYSLEIMKAEYKKGKRAEIIAIVLYTGKRKWNVPTNLGTVSKENKEKCKLVGMHTNYTLYCSNNYSDRELIKEGNALSIVLLLERTQSIESLIKKINEILQSKLELSEESRQLITTYIVNVLKGILGEEKTKELTNKLNNEKENFSMLEEVIRKEFFENRKRGIKDGIKSGKVQERRKTINRMSRLGFDVKQISEILGISDAEVNRMLIKKLN